MPRTLQQRASRLHATDHEVARLQHGAMHCEECDAALRRLKAYLIEKHNAWLDENDPEELYRRFIHARRLERILAFTSGVRGRVLDVGCFDGFVAGRILEQGGKEVFGLDRLRRALKLAESRGVRPVLADIDDAAIPFADGYFDCVVMGETLNYVFDPEGVVAEIRRVLKPGAKLIVTVPNLASVRNRIRLLLGAPPLYLDTRPREGGYWRYFTFKTIRALLCDHGFRIERMESNAFVLPWFRIPGIRRFFPGHEWERHRYCSSRLLASAFPTLGENIIVLAAKK